MDGTIADLYGVDGWLEMLIDSDPTPYEIARPLLRMATLARLLNRLQREGWEIGIVSWLSKSGTETYNRAVTEAKNPEQVVKDFQKLWENNFQAA